MEHKASETTHIQSTISTLRKENGWYSSNDIILYQYHGVWFYSTILQGILSDPHLSRWSKLSLSDTLICGYPKCGSTWLKSLAFAITTRNRYQVGDDDGKTKSNEDSIEIIPLHEAFDLFCDGISVFGPYWDHVLGYWNASIDHPSKVLFLKYEDMIKDPIKNVTRIADFMGYPFSNDERIEDMPKKIVEMCSFKSLSNLEVNKTGTKNSILGTVAVNDRYFRKGTIGDWENHLTPEMAMKIDDITKQKFYSFGLHL